MITYQLTLVILVFALLHAPVSAQNSVGQLGVQTITHEEVYNFCRTLSSPEFQGRYTSHEGHRAAAEWVASLFEYWGLRPYDEEEGFLLPYPSMDTNM